MKYEMDGFIGEQVSGIITLIVGIGVAVLVLIFVGTLGGQTYSLTAAKIDAITDVGIRTDVNQAIKSGFSALKTTGDYLPIIVIAIIVFMILGLVMGLTMGGRGQGSAL